MGRGDKVRMPASTAGITQYWDEVKTKVTFRPEHVVILAILVVIVIVLLNAYGKSWFGL